MIHKESFSSETIISAIDNIIVDAVRRPLLIYNTTFMSIGVSLISDVPTRLTKYFTTDAHVCPRWCVRYRIGCWNATIILLDINLLQTFTHILFTISGEVNHQIAIRARVLFFWCITNSLRPVSIITDNRVSTLKTFSSFETPVETSARNPRTPATKMVKRNLTSSMCVRDESTCSLMFSIWRGREVFISTPNWGCEEGTKLAWLQKLIGPQEYLILYSTCGWI